MSLEKKSKPFSVRFGTDISLVIIEIHDFEATAKPAVRNSLHRSVESHIQRGKNFIRHLKGASHGTTIQQT
jgi:hypothetical protein